LRAMELSQFSPPQFADRHEKTYGKSHGRCAISNAKEVVRIPFCRTTHPALAPGRFGNRGELSSDCHEGGLEVSADVPRIQQ
jgi:hypothetical protein